MGMIASLRTEIARLTPVPRELTDYRRHARKVFARGPKVPGFRKAFWIGSQLFRQQQVAAERFQDMLPGPNGRWIAELGLAAGTQRANGVGDQPVGGIVAA